jgi:hypothetical protein
MPFHNTQQGLRIVLFLLGILLPFITRKQQYKC